MTDITTSQDIIKDLGPLHATLKVQFLITSGTDPNCLALYVHVFRIVFRECKLSVAIKAVSICAPIIRGRDYFASEYAFPPIIKPTPAASIPVAELNINTWIIFWLKKPMFRSNDAFPEA